MENYLYGAKNCTLQFSNKIRSRLNTFKKEKFNTIFHFPLSIFHSQETFKPQIKKGT